MSENINNKKTAIVLFNLGGPDSKEAVKPFLFNLFNDKYIITLPSFFRYLIAWLISSRREKTAQEIYSYTGNKSPILDETKAQKLALEKALKSKINNEYEVFICMRHWHPMSEEVVKQVKIYDPNEIILLPLYPQYSTTTSASSIEDFSKNLKKHNLNHIYLKTICCYPFDDGFIKAHIDLLNESLNKLQNKNNYRILFSAHGLPQKIVDSGDPYQWQVEQTVGNIVKNLEIDNLDYKVTYQSRVGPLQWLKPNTEDEIKIAAEEKKSIVIVPIAFVSEHVETLVELDIEYKQIANNYGVEYIRVPALGTNQMFIEYLAKTIENFSNYKESVLSSSSFKKLCPNNFGKCPCRQ
jgi:protoporphyrin/coproporphyrin ferrochelatase